MKRRDIRKLHDAGLINGVQRGNPQNFSEAMASFLELKMQKERQIIKARIIPRLWVATLFCAAILLLPCPHVRASDTNAEFTLLCSKAEKGDAQSQFELGQAFYSGKFGEATNYLEAAKWFRKAAGQNYAGAQYSLGVCYDNGYGIAKDEVEAVKWWRKAAGQNDAKAQFNLGSCYREGQGVAKDEVEAVKWFRKAAGQNLPAAQYNLGVCYERGAGVARDCKEAVTWYRKAAEQNYAEAQHNFGVCYRDGQGVAKNEVEAVKWFRKAAEQDFTMAYYNLGACYDYGLGVTQNFKEAVEWYRKAAEKNCAQAQHNLGECYRTGCGVTKDAVEAVKWFRKAAEQNLARAQYNLGVCYQRGDGTAKDYVEAVKWFRKAAEQNDPRAQFNLGVCYGEGQGVAQNYMESYKWLLLVSAQGVEAARQTMAELERQLTPDQRVKGQKRASDFKPQEVTADPSFQDPQGGTSGNAPADLLAKAEAGDAKAQNELGEAFYAGRLEVMRDPVAAVKWFRKAAEQNLAAAQSNLGVCYERGDGVAKFEVEAYKWELLAAAQGDAKAKSNATLLELMMSPEQIAEGKQRAQVWLKQLKTTPASHVSDGSFIEPKTRLIQSKP